MAAAAVVNNGISHFRPGGASASGTGRRLPPTPRGQTQGSLPLTLGGGSSFKKPPQVGGPGGSTRPKRELPKPQSLELRHSNHEYMNISNAILGLVGQQQQGGKPHHPHSSLSNSLNRNSMNFPRLEGSPTHSECSSGSPPYTHRRRTNGCSGGYRRRNMDY